ncbi:MAG TPA: DUF4430 domain-containing protein [Miltoncostaea sp.]|nr:DUF4430 domain-containing protein [Miltoncostaea sp.]
MHRRSRRPVRLPVALTALLAVLALLAGCEKRQQDAPAADAPAATLVATADYGARDLLSTRVAPGQSVMRATRGATDVRTAYSGAYVSSMLGLGSDLAATRDWFFYVDGLVSSVGAKSVKLEDGDVVWWDHRDWGDLQEAPAVIGAWPLPWALPDDRGPEVSADPPLDAALGEAGARLVQGDPAFRVRVGASDDIAHRDPVWRAALADPDRAGLTVTIADGKVVAIGPDGGPRIPVPGARALIAAVPTGRVPEDGSLLVVAGLDADAAQNAAEALARDPGLVRLTYAVALDGEGHVLRAGGRP